MLKCNRKLAELLHLVVHCALYRLSYGVQHLLQGIGRAPRWSCGQMLVFSVLPCVRTIFKSTTDWRACHRPRHLLCTSGLHNMWAGMNGKAQITAGSLTADARKKGWPRVEVVPSDLHFQIQEMSIQSVFTSLKRTREDGHPVPQRNGLRHQHGSATHRP